MKYSIVIDREREEEVLIYAHERNKLVERLEEVLEERKTELVGFSGDEIVRIVPNEALCFTVEEGKTYADLARRLLDGHAQGGLPRLCLTPSAQSGQGKNRLLIQVNKTKSATRTLFLTNFIQNHIQMP